MPIDDRILETLDESDLILSPAVIAINIHKSRDEVNRRLSKLTDRGLVNRVKRGYYEIDELGRKYLNGEIDTDELEELGY